jgi:hypothetical protein
MKAKDTKTKEIKTAGYQTPPVMRTKERVAGPGSKAVVEGKQKVAEDKGAYSEQKFDPNPTLFGKRAGNYHDFLKTQASNLNESADRARTLREGTVDKYGEPFKSAPFSTKEAHSRILDDALDFAFRGEEDPEWDQAAELDKQRKKKFGFNDHAHKLQLAKKRGDGETHAYLISSAAENKKEKAQQGKEFGVKEVGPVSRYKRDLPPIEQGIVTPVRTPESPKGQHHALADALGMAFSNAGSGKYSEGHINAIKAIGDHLDEVGDLKGRVPNFSKETIDFVKNKYPNFSVSSATSRHEDGTPMFLSNSEAALLGSLVKVRDRSPKVNQVITNLVTKAAGSYMKAEPGMDEPTKAKIFSNPPTATKPTPHALDTWSQSLLGSTKGEGPGLVKRGVDAAVRTSQDKTLHGVKQHILDTMVKNGHDRQNAVKAVSVMDPFIRAALGETVGKSIDYPLEKSNGQREGSAGMTGGKFDKRQYEGSSSAEIVGSGDTARNSRPSSQKKEPTYIAQPPAPGIVAGPVPKDRQPIVPNAPRPSDQNLATAKEDFERQKALKQADTSAVQTLDKLRQAYLKKFQDQRTSVPVTVKRPDTGTSSVDFTTGVASRSTGSGEGILHDVQAGMSEDDLLRQIFEPHSKKPESLPEGHKFGVADIPPGPPAPKPDSSKYLDKVRQLKLRAKS